MQTERFNPHWDCLIEEAATSPVKSRLFPRFERKRPLVEPKGWSKQRALAALAIREVPFFGDPQRDYGISGGLEFGINPKAPRPLHTLIHELGHICLGHTLVRHDEEFTEPLRIREYSADSVAYIFMHDQGVQDQMDVPRVQSLMKHRLAGEKPSVDLKQRIFEATSTIIEAGRLEAVR
jgi:hypothetical protein